MYSIYVIRHFEIIVESTRIYQNIVYNSYLKVTVWNCYLLKKKQLLSSCSLDGWITGIYGQQFENVVCLNTFCNYLFHSRVCYIKVSCFILEQAVFYNNSLSSKIILMKRFSNNDSGIMEQGVILELVNECLISLIFLFRLCYRLWTMDGCYRLC